MVELKAQVTDSAAQRVDNEAALVNFPFISAYVDALWVVLHQDASADVTVLLDDLKTYVQECLWTLMSFFWWLTLPTLG